MKNWLTAKELNSISPGLGTKLWVIEKTSLNTSEHVNNLLSMERVSYVYATDNDSMIDLVDKWFTAFSYDQIYLDLEDGEIIIWVSETVEQKWQNVIYKWEKYSKENLKDRKVSIVVNNDKVQDSKELIWDEPYYSFYDAQSRKRYVLVKDVETEYSDADVRDMSVMELTGLPDYNINMKFLAWYFRWFEIPSPKFFTYINKQFTFASNFLEKRAPILASRKPFQSIKGITFASEEDIENFLEMLKSWDRRESITACTLLKFIFLLHKYKENPIFEFWEKCQESDDFTIAYIMKIFNLPLSTEIKKDSKGVFHFTKIFPEFSNAEIPMTFRVKSLDSMLQKSLWSATYLWLEDFRDIFASTAYIPDEYKKYTVDLMKQFDINLTQSDAYVKNKWFLTKENVAVDSDYKYQRAKWNIRRWKSSSDSFSDAKQIWEHPVDFEFEWIKYAWNIWMENRFLYGTPTDDSNETWLTCHPVYDYFAKHFEWEQNRAPFYTASNLAKLFDDFFDYLSNSLEKKYPELDLWQVMKDMYDELWKANETSWFPNKKSWKNGLKDFYHSRMKVILFKHFVDKFKLQRMSYGNELIFVSKENRHQLRAGWRWYKIKSI